MPLAGFVGRDAHLPIVAAWVAFVAGLLAGGEIEDAASFAISASAGAALVVLGFAAASRCRTLSRRPPSLQLGLLALAAGTALGIANLAANWLIARSHPTLRALLTERIATRDPVEGLIAAPLVEEVMMRLFLMSVIAWIVFRLTNRPGLAFGIGLFGSSLFFAVLHLARPFPGDPAVASLYRTSLVIKYTLAGLPLGWIFWRWGLPYSILCHGAANAAHLVLQRGVF